MSFALTIDGIGSVLSYADYREWELVEAAYNGEAAFGGVNLDDAAASLSLVAHTAFTATETAASPTRLATGYVADRKVARGPFAIGSQRQWSVDVIDLNSRLADVALRSSDANRPAETDYARVTWLLGHDALSFATAGVVPNTNTATLDAVDYRGRADRVPRPERPHRAV